MEIERESRSPNQKARPAGVKPSLVVLHASAGKSDAGDLSWMCNAASKVSYHYLIGRDGTVYELVPPERMAYHAGESEWKGRKFCNQYSIGVAWCNRHDASEPLTAAQVRAGRALLDWLAVKHPTLTEVVTHKDVAPRRKSDPHLTPNFHAPDWCGVLTR